MSASKKLWQGFEQHGKGFTIADARKTCGKFSPGLYYQVKSKWQRRGKDAKGDWIFPIALPDLPQKNGPSDKSFHLAGEFIALVNRIGKANATKLLMAICEG